MRAVIQRVKHASVTIAGTKKSEIDNGLLILLGICQEDNSDDVEWLVKKISQLRIFLHGVQRPSTWRDEPHHRKRRDDRRIWRKYAGGTY